MKIKIKGNLLVATKKIKNPYFKETIVLITEFSKKEGAKGLLLNSISDKSITIDSHTHYIHHGGPVFAPLVAIHKQKELSDAEIAPDIYYSVDGDKVHKVSKEKEVCLYNGYCGWSAGQLETEISIGNWVTTPIIKELVFFPKEEETGEYLHSPIWKKAINIKSEAFYNALGLKSFPVNVSCN